MKEKDDFWNLDRILPKSNTLSKQRNVETTEVTTGATSSGGVDVRALFSAINERKSVNSLESAIEKEFAYEHFNNSRVITYAYVGKYSNALMYDNRSRSYAIDIFNKTASKNAVFVEYFSFKPSFSELSREQLDYYLLWRENIRSGIFEKTSASYVFLMVSEIINLPDRIPPCEGQELIISLFYKCLDEFTRYERLISDILFEYSVVHNLPIPYEKISPIVYRFKNPISNILGSLFVFDYLLSSDISFSEDDLKFIFEKNLSFSYSSGKHYSANSKLAALLDSYFYKILGIFIKENPECISQIYTRHENLASPVRVIRPTFLLVNASCEVKKNIVFEYNSFDKTDVELLYLLNIAKCIENKFRGMCGIRARLTVTALDEKSRQCLDRIFDAVIPHKNDVTQQVKNVNRKVSIDVSAAQKIEESSWETTRMLTEGIEIFDEDTVILTESDNVHSFTELELTALRALMNKDTEGIVSECQSQGMFFDAVVMSINEKALEFFGDIVIDSENLSIYDDYLSDIEQFLK